MPECSVQRRSPPRAGIAVGFVAVAVAWWAGGVCAGASFPPSETLLPATTRVWVSAADPQGLKERFERSALGGLLHDPLMSTFLDDLRTRNKPSADPLRGSLEITAGEVEKVAAGEIALGVVERPDGLLATLLLVDTSGRAAATAAIVEAVRARIVAKGGTPLTSQAPVEAFAVPAAAGAGEGPPRQVAIGVTPGVLLVGDRLDAVAELAATIAAPPGTGGGRAAALASLPAFTAVAARCGRDVPAAAPTVRWFVDPLAYLAADRRTFPPKKPRKGPDFIAILRRQGFDAVTGAGGCVFFGEGAVDLRHNTLIHAPRPPARQADGPDHLQKAARMLRFPNAAGMAPATWLPGSSASWLALEWDIATAFAAMPPLVDEIVGEQGVFEDVIASLEEDPDGPQIDVRDGLVKHLGTRCMVASDHVTPVDADCERMLVAIETSDPAAVAAVLKKGLTSEGEVREGVVGGHVIWETVRPAAGRPAAAAGAADDADDAGQRRRARQRDRRESDDTVWPNLSVAVAHGHVLLASHRDFLERVLLDDDASEIVEDGDYRAVADELHRLLGGDWSLNSFSRSAREIRPAYELLRAGRLAESKGLAGTLLRRIVEGADERDGSPRGPADVRQKVDGSSLPEFDRIAQYFGVNGVSMQSTPDGWYLVGVGLWNGPSPPAAK